MFNFPRSSLRNVRQLNRTRHALLRLIPSTSQVTCTCASSSIIKRATAIPILPDRDAKLIQLGDFIGVKGNVKRPEKVTSPEVDLSIIEQHLRQNFRVSAEAVFCNVVKPLEESDENFLATLRNNHDRWLPTIFLSCGHAMSNVHKDSRIEILERIMQQIQKLEVPLSIHSFNAYLRVLMENDVEFNVDMKSKEAEVDRGLSLNQDSYRLLLEQLALQGSVDAFNNLSYEMANRGLTMDAHCNALLIYGYSILGHLQKASSLYEQTIGRYGAEGRILALEALAKSAAARNDLVRLRKILKLSLDEKKKLLFTTQTVFDIIWILTERSRTRDGLELVSLIEQILNQTNHQEGFFKCLIREIERHIAHEHYYVTLALLEDATKVKEFVQKQNRGLLFYQLQTRLCRQLVRNHSSVSKIKEVANRLSLVLKDFPHLSEQIYSELLKCVLTFKEFPLDTRFNYFSNLIDSVDPKRERPHLMLPLMASCDDVTARLTMCFRCENIGYKDFSQLDSKCLATLVLQPLYERQHHRGRGRVFTSKLDSVARIIKSFGFSDAVIWRSLHEWMKLREAERSRDQFQTKQMNTPSNEELRRWLQDNYTRVFEVAEKEKPKKVEVTYRMLKNIISSGNAVNLHSFITFYGWPNDTDFEQVIPKVLDLYIEQLDWPSIQLLLTSLSKQQARWSRVDGNVVSPVKNYHLLRLLRERLRSLVEVASMPNNRRIKSTLPVEREDDKPDEEIDVIRNLITYCYELRRLFPYAEVTYDTFFETIYEYRLLFTRCFKLQTLTLEKVEDCIELLRTLIKLNYLSLHNNETLSVIIIENVLNRFGWMEAMKTWMALQSGLYTSNGIIPLLMHASRAAERDPQRATDLQYILHKAQNFMPTGRVYSLYATVLISLKRYEEAAAYLDERKAAISSMHIVLAIRLMNNLKPWKQPDENLTYKLCEIFLANTQLKEDKEECHDLLRDSLRLCEVKKLGRLALRLYELFEEAGIDINPEQRARVMKLAEKHVELERRWLYKPQGVLGLTEEDEIVQDTDFWRRFKKYS